MAQRGYSSAGRAPPLQGGCQRFKSAYLHTKNKLIFLKKSLIQGIKSLWGIPWHSEATKDVVTDETLPGSWKQAMIRRIPNKETFYTTY